MCFLSTTFPNAPAHLPPLLFDQSLKTRFLLKTLVTKTFVILTIHMDIFKPKMFFGNSENSLPWSEKLTKPDRT